MRPQIYPDKNTMGREAARQGAATLRAALAAQKSAAIIVATGASQFEMLSHLAKEPDIDWHRVHGFHLDEYVGLPITHPASFRGYLWKRFLSRLPLPIQSFCYLDGENDPTTECHRAAAELNRHQIDVAFVGIGENGHLAFNDPPADFSTEEAYLVVDLDEACRGQQLGEGWFPTFDDVPARAISMSVKQIMKSKTIICTVPDERKSKAVQGAVEGPVSPDVPASILQEHPECHLFLDQPAASRLSTSS